MKFGYPYLLNLLWLLIPVSGILVYGILKQNKILRLFADANLLKIIAPAHDPKRRWIKSILVVVALGFAVIALSEPKLGFRWEKVEQKGVDIMIALDCSKSMLAQDIKPNRLERAKREILDLLKMMKSDRAGLVAFSGNALLQCPLTLDHGAFNLFLNVLEPGFLPVGGTNLSEAIQTSFEGFEPDTDTQKAIILITDGEDTSGNGEDIAQQMARQGIKIFCIGVGNRQGAPIPDETGGFKKDASGNIIMSKVDEKGLKKLADLTGGAYVRSVAGDMDLDLIYTDKILGTMTRKTLTSGKKKVWENRFQWFLFPCFLLLVIELAISSGNPKKVKLVFLLFFLFSSFFSSKPVYADAVFSKVNKGITAYNEQQYETAKKHFIDAQLEQPDNARLYYDIGTAAYMNQEYDQAEQHFKEAAKSDDEKVKHDAMYNLANTYYKRGDIDQSIKGYEQVLADFPEDTQARENLEFVKQKKKDQEKKQQQKQDKQNQKNQPKKDQPQKDTQQKDNQQKDTQQKNQPQDKDKSQGQNQPQQGQEQTRPENQTTTSDKDQTTAPSPAGNPLDEQAKKALENKLNRLKDKPGQAMMPQLRKNYVEKDW